MRRQQFNDLALELAEASTRSPVSVTITVPTHRHAPQNRQDPVRVRQQARAALSALEQLNLTRPQRRALTDRIEALDAAVDAQIGFDNTDLGVACYVTCDVLRVVSLGHTPPQRTIIADQFSLASPLADLVAPDDAEVLVLSTGGGSTDGARLYHLERGELVEPSRTPFPLSYDVRGRNRSYATAIESDKRDAHVEAFLRQVNGEVTGMFGADHDRKLVLVGIARLRDHWRKVAPDHLLQAVVAELDGNMDKVPLSKLRDQVVAAVGEAAVRTASEQIEQVASLDRSQVALAAQDVHMLAAQSRVHRLLVEEGASDEIAVNGVVLGDQVASTLRRCFDAGAHIVIVPDGALRRSPLSAEAAIVAQVRW